MWEHADFESEASDALRLAKLRLHMAEVEVALGKDMSADGISMSHGALTAKMARLDERRRELERLVGLAGGGRVSHIRMNRTR